MLTTKFSTFLPLLLVFSALFCVLSSSSLRFLFVYWTEDPVEVDFHRDLCHRQWKFHSWDFLRWDSWDSDTENSIMLSGSFKFEFSLQLTHSSLLCLQITPKSLEYHDKSRTANISAERSFRFYSLLIAKRCARMPQQILINFATKIDKNLKSKRWNERNREYFRWNICVCRCPAQGTDQRAKREEIKDKGKKIIYLCFVCVRTHSRLSVPF